MTREDAIKIVNELQDTYIKCRGEEDIIEVSIDSVDIEALDMAIKALEQESTSFEWCTDCKEYDQEKHCCHRYSKVIRDTVEEMRQEQETFINKPCVSDGVCEHDKQKVLDKIRAEIEELDDKLCRQFLIEDADKEMHHAYRECLGIIDKYKEESEE